MNIAIYTNILTPYRKHFFDALYEECKKNKDEFHVIVMAETEPGRNWHYEDMKTAYTILLNSKSIKMGSISIHINKNLIDVLEQLKLDVLVCAGSYLCPGIWSATNYTKKQKIRSIYWSESHLNESRKYSNIKKKFRELIRKQAYRRFDGFWYAGKLSKEFIECYCKKDADFFFMPNLVDEQRFYLKQEISINKKMKFAKNLDFH